jgi:pimeloyl-ACP methyl ester carboxylesterase
VRFAYSPIILINHALTGNSQVMVNQVGGMISWELNKILEYTIVSFDVPGNGFNSATIENYRDFIARDIARILLKGYVLKDDTLFALIGGSVGGRCLEILGLN